MREKEKTREALECGYGLLSGIIACITSNRNGVNINMMVEEFAQAEEDEAEQKIIWVEKCIIKCFTFHIINVNHKY